MTEAARLIIPVWGDAYAGMLVSATLPAVLAPGNLPALAARFDVELVIVTETRLFDLIRRSNAFQLAGKYCSTRLTALDDLMIDSPDDYGAVLTYALFRGFADLGARMTDTYLLFLNADFIVSDGSLGHVARLMAEGKRVIHAPSFRVSQENVSPQLDARVDAAACSLRLSPREMVSLALAHKHRTVKARIVNQRICHQAWMDQYYWYVDEQTLIGYQWPVALVAIKPQRVVSAPVLVWDYGFIPEAAPDAEPHFIADSDDFFMIEPQSQASNDAMIKVGWISFDDIARNLSMWTTKEQRECGRRLLKIHAGELPDNIDEVVAESRAYMAEIYRRLSPDSLPHVSHSYLGAWFEGAPSRMRGYRDGRPESADGAARSAFAADQSKAARSNKANKTLALLNFIYRKTFGSPPQVGRFHPLWADTAPITTRIAAWRSAGEQKILWMKTGGSLLHRLLRDRVEPAAVLTDKGRNALSAAAPYDACVCELTLDELSLLNRLYAALRPLMKNGAHVVFSIAKDGNLLDGAELLLERTQFPAIDISEIHFFGTVAAGFLRALYLRAVHSFQKHPVLRALTVSAVLIVLAPLVRLANSRAAARDTAIFSPRWTSLAVEFTVKRRAAIKPEQEGSVHMPIARDG